MLILLKESENRYDRYDAPNYHHCKKKKKKEPKQTPSNGSQVKREKIDTTNVPVKETFNLKLNLMFD